jgi:hypothetical protein
MKIFITAECSKRDIVHEAFKYIYDGTPKAHPKEGDASIYPYQAWKNI